MITDSMASLQNPPPKWGDSISQLYEKNGIYDNRHTQRYGTKIVQTKYAISDYETDRTLNQHGVDERVKRTLVEQLVNELYNSKHIDFVVHPNTETFQREYSARVNIVDKEFNSAVLNVKSFYMDGKEFNENKIQEALRNTFPEEFI